MGQQCRLGKSRQVDLFVGVAKGKLCNIVTENPAGLVINFSDDRVFLIEVTPYSFIL